MVACGVILIVLGALGLTLGPSAYGDISVAIMLGGAVGLVSGIACLVANKRLKQLSARQ